MSEDRFEWNELEQVAQEELQAANAPGAAIAVVSGEKLLFAKGLGISHSETGAPVSPEMLFRIGSLTKMITAYTLISLVQEHHIDVHTPIGLFVPDLPPQIARLTIHQLLSHTAGLKDDFSHYGPHDEAALGNAVRAYGDRHFFTEPGRLFSYSALGYAVAGVVIEALGKKPYAQLVSERVLGPLKMERSTFFPTMAMTYPLSQGHLAIGSKHWEVVRPYDDTAARWPSGFLFSSVTELARFVIAFMNQGYIEGEQRLDPSIILLLTQPHSRPLDASGKDQSYGYGLGLNATRGVSLVQHSGGRRGFISHLLMVPSHRFAFIQLINRQGPLLEATKEKAMEMLLPLEARPDPPPDYEGPLTEDELHRFTGRFAPPDIHATSAQDIQVIRKEEQLLVQFGDEGQLFPLRRHTETQFSVAFGPHLSPFMLAFHQGTNEREDYLGCASRAHKRVNEG